ncbi:MAG: D-cysteine desulfhydrase family protein [Rhodobacteraceae bacterium]|nr:D-cysteine desulfhydrase family protein [Paracoccaceae bacterium]
MPYNIGALDSLPRSVLSQTPTALHKMPNLTAHFGTANLFIKRDDCTGLALGGNKARQLEFYLGQAEAEGADTIIITGAVQSNFTRMAAAAARMKGMDIHIQLEERVANTSEIYHRSGNLLLSRIYGATLHTYPYGEDEAGADNALEDIANTLRAKGQRPYVIHLSQGHAPLGALGYVVAAHELCQQGQPFDEIIVASGSGATHAGLLFGLRALGNRTPVRGICVRRDAAAQAPRIIDRCQQIANLLKMENPVKPEDISLNDDMLPPGYGKMNEAVIEAITLTAQKEGILLDPVYTGKTMAGFFARARQSKPSQNLLFIHTGGQPALFGYEDDLGPLLSDTPF